MGIFEFSRPDNYSKISEEWQIFENVFPDTGAFEYLSGRKSAYLDDNSYRILRLKKTSEDGSMSEDTFFDLLKKITVEPVYNMRHIYNYSCGNENFWIKLSMVEKDGRWLGFIKDMTSKMQDIAFSESFTILDSVTRLNNREAFLEELRILSETRTIESGCLAVFHINGINYMNKILGIDNSKKCVSCASRTISHFTSDDLIIGSTPYREFLVFFKNKTEEQSIALIKEIADAVHETKITDDFGEALIPGSDAHLSLNCGYSVYPSDSEDFNNLVDYSGFALFEILENTTGMIKKFERKTYEKEREDYTDSQIFCKIIEDNLFEYHMQPIVNAKTGVVYGYEALMRTTGNKYLNPFQMLEIAKKQKRMYDIEKMTFFNVMKILAENIDMFKDKKLFINSIPNHMLNDDDFEKLYNIYGGLMDKVVIEITEQAELTNGFLETINSRKNKSGFEIAFDDYGTGYANTANLIRCNPEYIKIDRSLITNIDTDPKRRQLVAAVVGFADENGIKTLAEGIETFSELSTVINIGVDLIQGYYTSRPKPFILYEISSDVRDEIVNVNASRSEEPQSYCVSEDIDIINLESIDTSIYNQVLVRRSKVKINGGNKTAFKSSIVIGDDINCTMTIEDVFINNHYGMPSISVGENSDLTIVVKGKNTLKNSGIYVPETAKLTIVGDGFLEIIAQDEKSYGIGNVNGNYGDITVDMTGRLTISVNGLNTIAIGGIGNPRDKKIDLKSGDIFIQNTGKSCVSVGNIEGNSIVEIGKSCVLEIESASIESVAVGSIRNSTNISSRAKVIINGSGSNIVGMGVLEGGTGIIDILEGNVDISFGARHALCIGTHGGDMNTRAENVIMSLNAEGVNVIGIGDCIGGGNVSLSDNNIQITLNGENTIDIGSPMGTIQKNGNNIISKINY